MAPPPSRLVLPGARLVTGPVPRRRLAPLRRRVGALRRRLAGRPVPPPRPAPSAPAAPTVQPPMQPPPDEVAPLVRPGKPLTPAHRRTEDARAAAVRELAGERARAALVHALRREVPAPLALIDAVRELSRQRRWTDADALASGFATVEGVRAEAAVASTLFAYHRGWFEQAAQHARQVPRALLLEHAPAEYAGTLLVTDPGTGRELAAQLLDAGRLPPDGLLALARTAFGVGELDLVGRSLAGIAGRADAEPAVADEARWLDGWLARARDDRPRTAVPAGRVPLAVLDYKSPDWTQSSANLGDQVQTLASLGHLVRHQDLRLHAADPALQTVLRDLQLGVRADRQLRLLGPGAEVEIYPVNRDASSLDRVPDGTWLLAFGWYMHHWFRVRYDFPFHPALRPIFVSFHLNHTQAVTDEGVAYLRAAAPVGCRDWTTVFRMLDLGVPAFLSGCLTTTVEMHFPVGSAAPADAPVGLVDVAPGTEPALRRASVTQRQSSVRFRSAPLADNLRRAHRLLRSYREDYSSLVTSRLHCYLPARSLGVPVDFRTARPDDVRFAGLVGTSDDELAEMQARLRDLLQTVLVPIVSGADESTVRSVWAAATAPDVAAAQQRWTAQRLAPGTATEPGAEPLA